MLCILCITTSNQIIQIFDELGMHLDACNIISKYFWLKPSAEDPKAQIICRSCWSVLDSFHRFYQMVEEAHSKLATTKTFNDVNASESDDCCSFPEIPTTEYDIKSEVSDETNVDLKSIYTPDIADKGIALSLVINSTARNSECNLPPVEVKIESEINGESRMGIDVEKTMSMVSDSESEIPLAKLSARKLPVRAAYKKSTENPKSRAKCKDGEKKGIPCQEFDDFIRQNMNLSCTICQKSLSSFFVLKEHYQSVHNENGYVICCEKKFDSRHGLVHHIQLHKDPDHFKCAKCGRVLANKKSLKNHMKMHNNKDQTYSCGKCKKSFFWKEKLDRHLKTHVKREKICEHCGKVTRSLWQHMLRDHSGIPKQRVQCPKCGATLSDKSSLYRHMKYVHPENDALHVCNICGKISSSGRGLKRHILYMHKATRRHQCPMCEKAFKLAQILRPSAEDPKAQIICRSCWSFLDSFHRFYQMVEEAHSKLATNKIFNEDNASESDNCSFLEIPTTEYDIKSEVSDETKVDLRSIYTPDIADKGIALSLDINSTALSERICTKRNSECNSPPPVEVKIEPENNSESKIESAVERIDHTMSDSESEIPLAKLSARKLPVPAAHKKITQNLKSRAKCKDTEKRRIPCQEFDDFIRQNMNLSCTICQKSLSSFFVLKEHYLSVHNENGYVICCEKKIDSRPGLVHHIQLHKDPDHFKCAKCGRVLANKKSLNNHMKTHDNKDETYRCEKCKKSFFRKERLDRHLKTHVRREQICEHCGKVTRCLRQHLLREHSGIPKERVQCPKCTATLADNSSLYTHMKYVHPENDASHVCNICGKSSTSARGLERHILYMHKATRRHQCPMCEKAFKFAQILRPNVNDVNAKVICTPCWCALNTFHNFYLQVEQAHAKLQETIAIDKDELKVENDSIATQRINQINLEPFDEVTADLLNADIKLEVQEDVEVKLLPEIVVAGTGKKEEYQKGEPYNKVKHSTDSERSFEHEAPPASSTRSRTSAEKSYTEIHSSSDDERDNDNTPDWQNHNSDNDDDDSDYVDNSPKTSKGAECLSTTKKRGRPKKGQSGDTPRKRKRTSEEQSKNMERIQEYDELIAKNMKLSCSICVHVSPNFAALKKHYRVIHNECGYAACCGKKFRKRGVLVDHIYTHKNPEYFKCEKCGKVLANRKCLDCHMLTHDTEKQRTYQCDQCPMSFYTRPLLTRHLQTHISVRNIKCPDCDKFFSTQDILRTHINNVHNAAYNRICDQCGKLFRRPDAFRRHQLEHDGITQPLVPCEKCGVKLTSKYGLKRHMESMHPETEVTHVCGTCGKIAPSAAALQRHISYMHKMERKYKCPMCDKAFKKTGGLKVSKFLCDQKSCYCDQMPKTAVQMRKYAQWRIYILKEIPWICLPT